MDRRLFMGSAVAALLPVSLLAAPESRGDWQLDDVCGAYPGYTYDMRRVAPLDAGLLSQVPDSDQLWVA
jgi:hypothetical protein